MINKQLFFHNCSKNSLDQNTPRNVWGETVLKVLEIKIKINLNKAPKNTLKIALKPLKKYYLIYYITSIYID